MMILIVMGNMVKRGKRSLSLSQMMKIIVIKMITKTEKKDLTRMKTGTEVADTETDKAGIMGTDETGIIGTTKKGITEITVNAEITVNVEIAAKIEIGVKTEIVVKIEIGATKIGEIDKMMKTKVARGKQPVM